MSIFTLDEARIMRIFNANGVKMSLKKAFTVANLIYGAHLERVNEVENNAWDLARKEANGRVESAFEDGYGQGKAHGERLSNFTAENDHTKLVARASIWANGEFSYYNLERKIACIKHLRAHFPSLDLRTAKCIVETCDGSGVGVRF
ncbi:hypothetical protein SEA_TRIBUTE_250 [Streptomyces phage Tribute]|jgi:hypothetical protein|uniref:Uncharacterized protein n=3 Tax=Samistivirus peebs TaxID=2560790 RepID=A0A5Q2WKV5_9CAUD|nr:hypothetical protein FDI38_gp004 [Streptomyces phage Peebs]YP_009611420.1 hypothetical protein FDI38_gp056 [Streptomyces phage Peebs]QGH78199.1 hypothetical protein SEA_TRIBUTE_4 [Streptomyces phage Tribute]QRI46001.1 hypothetical protein SEA_CROSS_4 [Streptomyces phage Cross]WDS51802.1 hypothetical protein SEA_PEPPERWOOD_254 [Streptomyces phage Pepperwood]WNN95366.1 hypothetical protein SEA_WATERMOORE_4 [Streptomyces phage Watermoore]ASR77711.1 hypothetical protein SEA_PEEBS_4 [Streptomyc